MFNLIHIKLNVTVTSNKKNLFRKIPVFIQCFVIVVFNVSSITIRKPAVSNSLWHLKIFPIPIKNSGKKQIILFETSKWRDQLKLQS